MLPINERWMTRNDCYKANRRLIAVDFLIVHSTATPGVMAADWFSRWNKSYDAGEINRKVCAHGFVDDKSIWQYLPLDWRAWQIGKAWGNSHSIGFEMCEDKGWTEEYFRKTLKNMVELYAWLAVKYAVPVKKIIGHYEAYQLGIGSNHSDPAPWFGNFGYTMDDFRLDVQKEIDKMAIVIQRGMKGDAVKKLQADLNTLGYKLEADGIFGLGTEATVKQFQKDHGLVVDGIAGAKTLAKIEALVATPAPSQDPEVVEKIVEVLPAGLKGKPCSFLIEGITFEQAVELLKAYPNAKINL